MNPVLTVLFTRVLRENTASTLTPNNLIHVNAMFNICNDYYLISTRPFDGCIVSEASTNICFIQR